MGGVLLFFFAMNSELWEGVSLMPRHFGRFVQRIIAHCAEVTLAIVTVAHTARCFAIVAHARMIRGRRKQCWCVQGRRGRCFEKV